MRELQAKIIEEMGVQPRIDPAGEVRKRVTFLKEYLTATHTKGFVLGISGGLDSSLAGRLAQLNPFAGGGTRSRSVMPTHLTVRGSTGPVRQQG